MTKAKKKSKVGLEHCTKEEKARRLIIVARLLLDGKSATSIHQFVNQDTPTDGDNPGWKSWKLSYSRVAAYVVECRKNWAADTGERTEMLAEYIARLNDLYEEARQKGRLSECRNLVREIADLQGFYKFRVDLGKVELAITEAPKPGEEGSRV